MDVGCSTSTCMPTDVGTNNNPHPLCLEKTHLACTAVHSSCRCGVSATAPCGVDWTPTGDGHCTLEGRMAGHHHRSPGASCDPHNTTWRPPCVSVAAPMCALLLLPFLDLSSSLSLCVGVSLLLSTCVALSLQSNRTKRAEKIGKGEHRSGGAFWGRFLFIHNVHICPPGQGRGENTHALGG